MNLFLKQELEKRQHEFISYKELSILAYTWNVNGKKPPFPEIEDLFRVKNLALGIDHIKITKPEDIPDIIIFNFQEIVPLNAKSMISTGQQPSIWEKYIISELNNFYKNETKSDPGTIFVDKLASHVQMGLFQVVLVKKSIQHLI